MGDCRDDARDCRCGHMLRGSEVERLKAGWNGEEQRERRFALRGWIDDRMGRAWLMDRRVAS